MGPIRDVFCRAQRYMLHASVSNTRGEDLMKIYHYSQKEVLQPIVPSLEPRLSAVA